jgi:hypothetical protein
VAATGGLGHRPAYNLCCRGGRIILPKFTRSPAPLSELAVYRAGARANEFMRLIRSYCAFLLSLPLAEG